jgi:hypothetical protein
MRPPLATALAVAGLTALAACSSDPGTTPSSTSETSPPTTPTSAAAAGPAKVSPGGVTTAVDAPAESTEEGYFQACNAAKMWIDQRGGDRRAQIEPYLATLQRSDSAGPGTFRSPWSQLTPGRQAGVIVAVQAAADGLCG